MSGAGAGDGGARSGAEAPPLQAVVVADVFHDRLSPAVDSQPFALLPLVGVAIIDYTLESLAQSGVEETFLFCSSHVDIIKSHIQKAKEEKAPWSVSMQLRIIISENCHSFGDALRDLDAKGFIRGYFILMGIDSISNVKLLPLLEKHKEVCKKDRGAVMTLLFKTAYPGHRSQSTGENLLLVSNTKNDRVLYHQKLLGSKQSRLVFPTEIFLHNADVAIHSDLIDTNIAICSPDVLPLFADNFDFQTRDDFIKGILMNEEILSNTIYYHQLEGDQYAAKISNWQMYQTISQDIINRWVFPFAPDMGLFKQHQNYVVLKNHVYRHKNVNLAKGCELKKDVIICEKSSIGENTKVERSVIGVNCVIGNNCHISDSFILDNCRIEENAHISASVLSSNCILKKKVTLEQVVLGSSVELNANTHLKNEVIQCHDNDGETKKISEKAYIILQNVVDNESVSELSEDENNETRGNLAVKWWDEKSDVVSSSSDEESSDQNLFVAEDENLFLQEVIDSLARGYAEKLECDCLILEINSSRYAYNMSLQEVNYNVILALFNLPSIKSTTNLMKSFEEIYKIFQPIIGNYIKGIDAMVDCLKAVEESCVDIQVKKNIAKIIHFLYENDVITEFSILKWHKSLIEEQNPLSEIPALNKLIEWLNEASEESESD
ncbi:eukaryotic translation initiation factor 2B subunit epsilon [Arctopsyche grandis]|uniref:eukaryotic translation initiation factor 2B subunit epsilon n=1 Tax=Arctopsyche grandis TaxID=121162 RepID=UPI00406D9398